MYRHLLRRNRIFLSPFGHAVLYSTTSPAVLRGWVILRLNFKLKGYCLSNIYGLLDMGIPYYNSAAGSFHTKKITL